MTTGHIYRFKVLVLAMVISGSLTFAGIAFKAYGGDLASGVVLELRESDREALSGLGKGVVGKALPAMPIVDTARFMPLTEGKWTYRVLAGDHKGGNQEDFIDRPKRDKTGQPWRRVVGKKWIEYYCVRGDGDIVLTSEADLQEDVITIYTPGYSVIYDGMRPGGKKEVETDIRVYDLHDPTDEKYKGRLKVTHIYVGVYEVVVPAGKYQAVLIKSTCKGKVGPASVDDVGYLFYAAGTGIVASVERSHVSAFLIYNKTTKTPKILLRREVSVSRTDRMGE